MKTGDTVAVVDDNLSGTVISVIGNMVTFHDEYGFSHQYPAEQLVVQNKNLYENMRVALMHERNKQFSKSHQKPPCIGFTF